MTTISQQINELARSDNEECRLIISESMSPLQVQQAVAEIHTKFVGKKFRHLTLVYQGAMAEQTTVTPEILSALLLLNLPTLQTITVSGASVERSDELLDMLQQNYAVQSLKLTTSDKSLSDAITKMVRRNHQLCALERSDLMRKRGHQWRLLLRFPQWAALGLGTTLFSFVPLAAVILVAPWMTPA